MWRRLAVTLCWCSAASLAWAGAQIEEHLSDAVRTALSAAIANQAPPHPVLLTAEDHLVYEQWFRPADTKLIKLKLRTRERAELLQTVWYEATRAGLDPSLILGLIEVESHFRKFAISRAGARGYMQVMPFWARLIGRGSAGALFHMQTNLRFGCVILRYYLDSEHGNLFYALGRYNGSRGQAAYPQAVLNAQKHWL